MRYCAKAWPVLTLAIVFAITVFAETQPKKLHDIYGELPIAFEQNRGQTAFQARYLARGAGYSLFLTPTAAVLSLRRADRKNASATSVLRMVWQGAASTSRISGEEKLPGIVNYLKGKDPAQWRTDIPTFARVRYRNIYPGVDLLYYGAQRRLEYDLVVAPGAELANIKMGFAGMQRMHLAKNGDLVLSFPEGEVYQHRPVIYQELKGKRQSIEGKYRIQGGHQVGIEVADYDRKLPLVIDPVLSYSTYVGGSGLDDVSSIAVDGSGRAYVTGSTASSDFPVKNARQGHKASPDNSSDAFVSKFSATGGGLIYSTYLGGSDSDQGNGIGVDSSGNAYVVGHTFSPDFPTTSGAVQATRHGPLDAFVTKISPSGCCLVYSTYLGGNSGDVAQAMALDSTRRVYITGNTGSVDFPLVNPAQGVRRGDTSAFVARLNASGSALDYSTFLGGNAMVNDAGGIAVDSSNRAYVTGRTSASDFPVTPGAFQRAFAGGDTTREEEGTDGFVTRFTASGQFSYSTYLGGSDNDSGNGIAVDSSSRAYITGSTASRNFPVTTGAFQRTNHGLNDAFVTRLNGSGSGLSYSTYLGGSGSDVGRSIAVNTQAQAHVAGSTLSTNFPVKNALQATSHGSFDVFVVKLFATGGGRHYSTYLGGSGTDTGSAIRLDGSGNAYFGGETCGGTFPTTPGAFRRTPVGSCDGFVAKISP